MISEQVIKGKYVHRWSFSVFRLFPDEKYYMCTYYSFVLSKGENEDFGIVLDKENVYAASLLVLQEAGE